MEVFKIGGLEDLAKGLFCLAAKELLGADDTEDVDENSANELTDDYTSTVYHSANYDNF